MKTDNAERYAALAALLTLGLPFAYAKENKINRSELPVAVEKTASAASFGASIRGFSTERENGKRVYEVEMILNGHTKDLQIAEDRTLNEVEEEVAFDSLPAGIQTALNAKAKLTGATITKVESLTKKGSLVAYEAATRTGTKKGEIQVGSQGGRLRHSE